MGETIKPGTYESLCSRIGRDLVELDRAVHKCCSAAHDPSEMISCINPLTGAVLAVTLVAARHGEDLTWPRLVVRDGDRQAEYVQVSPIDAQYVDGDIGTPWDHGPHRLAELAEGVRTLREIAERLPELVAVGPTLPPAQYSGGSKAA